MNKKRIISASEAILEATDLYLKKDTNFLILGEGVNDPKGIFGTTLGLSRIYGKDRIIESPISENGMTGISIGLSMNNFKVLLIHQRVEFALLSLEQIFNNAAKSHFVSNGNHSVPLVIRMIIGRGWGQGPAHSQSLETIFSYVPGLKVLMPSSAYDAKGMLLSSINDLNPVIILEHRWFHFVSGYVPKRFYTSDIKSPQIKKKGKDISVVANSYNLYECLLCEKVLNKFGISLELIDLRVLRPLNIKPILSSVRKTGNLLIVETGYKTYGIGAEILSLLYENKKIKFDTTPSRIGLPDMPTPSSRELSKYFYPSSKKILLEIIKILKIRFKLKKKIITYFDVNHLSQEIDIPNPEFKGPF